MKLILSLLLLLVFSFPTHAQQVHDNGTHHRGLSDCYAYIEIQGRAFSKKLKVRVDLGDSPAEAATAKEYTDSLSVKSSIAAVLNFMAARGYELVSSQALDNTYQGTSGRSITVFIMKYKPGPAINP